MSFVRPVPASKLSPSEKSALLQCYYSEYGARAKTDPNSFNVKIDRSAFAELIDHLGQILLAESAELSSRPGPIRDFLDKNSLPASLVGRLPDEFRAYCLALNALKQWLAAEQNATDRYLLGGTARAQCRAAAKQCVLSGVELTPETVELHHPVRDGRPPIPVSKEAHAKIEGQSAVSGEGSLRETLLAIKRKGNHSWVQLRNGCQELLGLPVAHSTRQVGATSKTFARKASAATSLGFQELLNWLDENELGRKNS